MTTKNTISGPNDHFEGHTPQMPLIKKITIEWLAMIGAVAMAALSTLIMFG